jgi:hypothetical protein
MTPRLGLRFLHELLAPLRCHMAGASTFGAGLATERQAAWNVALALTHRACSQRWFLTCRNWPIEQIVLIGAVQLHKSGDHGLLRRTSKCTSGQCLP